MSHRYWASSVDPIGHSSFTLMEDLKQMWILRIGAVIQDGFVVMPF